MQQCVCVCPCEHVHAQLGSICIPAGGGAALGQSHAVVPVVEGAHTVPLLLPSTRQGVLAGAGPSWSHSQAWCWQWGDSVLASPQSLPQICSAGDGHAFTSALRQLYMEVTLQEAKKARKRHHPGKELLAGRWGNEEYFWVKPPSQGNGNEDLDAAHSPLL